MKRIRTASILTAAALLSVSLSGVAYGADETITGTGPGSVNQANINNNVTVNETNNNNVTVTNQTAQTSTTGSANVSGNTNGGSAMSGSAMNTQTTSTTVSINNPSGGVLGGGLGSGSGSGSGGGQGVSPQTAGIGAGSGSGALALGGVGAGVLPATGAKVPMDVSALRALYHPATTTVSPVVRQTKNVSATLLLGAALLSLIGAIASAFYAAKRLVKA